MGSPKFYVASPLGDRTAGPEALTQLVDAMRRRGIEAYLIPMVNFRGRKNDPEYDIYDFEVAERITDPENSYFVLSEVSPIESYRELKLIPRERTWMGWFSVNNSPDPRARYFRPSENSCSTFPPGFLPEIPAVPADLNLDVAVDSGMMKTIREAKKRVGGANLGNAKALATEAVSIAYAQRVVNSDINFFAQSFYGQGFVRQILGKHAPIITDPIRIVDVPNLPRERNVVLYNKVKSWSLIPDVMKLMPNVEFRAIEGMSYQQVVEALSTATVYLELGHLPGRDRMPREAAHFGTPVVCLARGAGYCWQDVPLPVDYRIAYREGWAAQAVIALQRVIDNPVQAAEDQVGYREWVSGERERYESAVDVWLDQALRQ
jgi:hypothetical protein